MTRLDWSGCDNARDLGGLPAGTRTVHERALLRSDSLTRLDEDGLRTMRGYGVSRVVDLRAEAETADPPHPMAGTPDYVNVPWADVALDEDSELVDFYVGSLAHSGGQIGEAVRAFADAPEGPVLVHCAVGKDRTGIVVALLLTLAGVPREAVVADYAESAANLGVERYLALLDATERPRAERFAGSSPETLMTFLDRLDQDYGGVRAYLRTHGGLSDHELDRAVQRLVG